MNLRLLIDMNMSPEWVAILSAAGYDTVHWTEVGDPKASDQTIMAWARGGGRVVITFDLDFGTVLALTGAKSPSVLQIRANSTLPEKLTSRVISTLRQYTSELQRGALVVVEESRSRVRVLPF